MTYFAHLFDEDGLVVAWRAGFFTAPERMRVAGKTMGDFGGLGASSGVASTDLRREVCHVSGADRHGRVASNDQ